MDIIEQATMDSLRKENTLFQFEMLEWKTEAKDLWTDYKCWLNADNQSEQAFNDWFEIKYPELSMRERICLMLDFYKEMEAGANDN